MAAGVTGAIGVFCFSRAGLEILERYLDPAESWAIVGAAYAVLGAICYFLSLRRSRR